MSKKLAIITGATAGIGLAFARKLTETHNLVLVARNKQRLTEIAGELQTEVQVLAADLAEAKSLAGVEEFMLRQTELDLLVNNAGFGTVGEFAELALEDEATQVQLNVLALTRLAHCGVQAMVKTRGGAIINVSSLAAFQPAPYSAVYGATKAYVKSFSQSLNAELKDSGIKVQALCPGLTHTEFHERAQINTSNVPDFMWQSAEDVVKESLEGLKKNQVVVVPGLHNAATAAISSLLPGNLTASWAAAVMKQTLAKDK